MWSWTGDPGFVDVANGNFDLKEESKARELGFQPIPFERIGLYLDELPQVTAWPTRLSSGNLCCDTGRRP